MPRRVRAQRTCSATWPCPRCGGAARGQASHRTIGWVHVGARGAILGDDDPESAARFLARFTPDVAKLAKGADRADAQATPGALELVYDNYNALAIGVSPTERAADGIFSIAVFPPHPSLFFLQRSSRWGHGEEDRGDGVRRERAGAASGEKELGSGP